MRTELGRDAWELAKSGGGACCPHWHGLDWMGPQIGRQVMTGVSKWQLEGNGQLRVDPALPGCLLYLPSVRNPYFARGWPA